MTNEIQPGRVIELTAPAGGVVSGKAYVIGSLAVVAAHSADAGKKFQAHTCGVFELDKATAVALTEGGKAYLTSAGLVTPTASGNSLIGASLDARDNDATKAIVRLNGTTI